MLKIAGLRSLRVVTRFAPSTEHARPSTMAHRARADRINKPGSVGAEYTEPATDAQRLRAAGLHQPASVAGLTNMDTGLATLAERMRADGIN